MSNQKRKQNNIVLTIIIIVLIVIISVVLSFAVIITLFNNSEKEKKEYTASEITSTVVKKMKYENLSEISSSNISKYYDIPEGTVDDCSMYISTRSDNFTEIACFRLTSEDKQEQLIEVINDYIGEKAITYNNVGDNAYSTVTASKTDIKYPYVFVAVTPDSEAAINALESIVAVDSDSKTK